MIIESEIIEAGKFNKPHGIKGEISATVEIDIELDDVKCIIIPVDGIYVPFFIESVRPKNNDTYLITIDGVDSEEKAQYFTNRRFFILKSDLDESDKEYDEEDGFYAADLIGYTIDDDRAGKIGTITDINDTTQNVLFLVETENGEEVYVPVADEFIVSVDTEGKIIRTSLPDGIVDLNN